MKTKSAAALILLLSCAHAPLHARTWKEAGSDRTIEGEYLRTEGDQVIIVRSSGNSVKIPLSRLSDEDKKFATEQAAAKSVTSNDVFKWETDFEVAKKRAEAENKPMLLDFTGSDWCGWCIKLKKEVFSKPEFEEYAKKNLVLVELDFPQQKRLPAKEKEQNEKLSKEYKVTGFPKIVLLDSKAKEVARTGYKEGGPEKYVEHLKDLLK